MKLSTSAAIAINVGARRSCFRPLSARVDALRLVHGSGSRRAPFPAHLAAGSQTLANYRELFAREGMGRYFVNSLLLATCATLWPSPSMSWLAMLSPSCDLVGESKSSVPRCGAIVIPAQVAMLPLFLLLKSMGLVNTYAGVLVPGLATIFGIALVRQYALSIPDEMLKPRASMARVNFRIFCLNCRSRAEANPGDARDLYVPGDLE